MDDTIIVKNPDLNETKTKNMILKYLRQKIETNIKMENIINMDQLDVIKNNNYVVCPRLNGTRSWVVFFKHNSIYYAVSFPKHHISRQDDTRIYTVDVEVKPSVYNGTVMEGIYYKDNNKKYLVIDEVYYFDGEDQTLKPKISRLKFLSGVITKKIRMKDNFKLCVSSCYELKSDSLTELYSKIKTDNIQEIVFYPKTFGKKIYKYNIIDTDLEIDVINLTTFEMHKTKSPDVYNLFDLNTNKKIGIAYIPDLDISKKCNQWFKENKTKKLNVNCKLHAEKNRWIPIEIL